MTDHMGDEKFEEFLQREARAYNNPPASVPRDEMYAAIVAARVARPKIEDRRPRTPRIAWIGMAATLVVGVAIGKFALNQHDAVPAVVAVQGHRGVAQALSDTSTASYARAATAQLVRAEALLTAYSAGGSAPNAGVDKQLSSWARDILSNTRLLLDSPAADDPARRRLLQDLELVLVQMVQRSPAAGAGEERAHIERSLDRTQVLSRLRSALPAGHNNGI
jgi:hypothetical protein